MSDKCGVEWCSNNNSNNKYSMWHGNSMSGVWRSGVNKWWVGM